MTAEKPTQGLPLAHESAVLHVCGEARYVDDIPEPANTCYIALGMSTQAHARICSLNLDAVNNAAGVIAVLTADDIPGANDCGPIIKDDPIMAESEVLYVGQPIFAVVADTMISARKAARLATVDYEPLDAVLEIREGKEAGSLVMPVMHLQQGDTEGALQSSEKRLQGQCDVGGQEQFYLEGQISMASPSESGGIDLWCSTQHPSEMQAVVAHMLKLDLNQVEVRVRRMGGGFGGKESQSALFACIASLVANKLQRPAKLRLDRDDDMMITGKRHDFVYDYDVGFDQSGRINAARVEMAARSGFSADLSGPVMTRALCHFDNAYFLPAADMQGHCVKTNTQSNTAFRGFGGPQGAFVMETIMDNLARELGEDPLEIRKRNFYGTSDRNETPYGQTVKDNVIHELVSQLEASSDYANRRKEIADFNADSEVHRRGIALTPLKFGISFNVVHFNQAGALVHVYTDGSVLVNHGGTEMGQGLHTKVCQVVALTLGIDPDKVMVTATDTSKVANTSATAASTGADLNARAAQQAAITIRERLLEFAASHWSVDPEQVNFQHGRVDIGGSTVGFDELVQKAYENRVQLWSDGFYKTPDLSWDRETMKGSPFYYFAYGAAVSEVIVDTLTGEFRLLRTDILHDAGNSINPAIDKGQIEGGFIQGMGWLTSEELVWNDQGRLTTHAPSTYKIPAVTDCPAIFNTELFDNPNVMDTVMRSKAVGEPPLLLAFSVFFAIRDAIGSLADQKINPPLSAPATPEAVLDAIEATREMMS